MTRIVFAGDLQIGAATERLAIIAGPCMAESAELCLRVAERCRDICARLGLGYVFKASFDKANRTSVNSQRGPGLEAGLDMLQKVRRELMVPVCTDVHETWQVEHVARVADMLQIPAFLCRQTDLILACARSGRCVNIKKGQFMAPWDMRNAVEKVVSVGNHNVILTERGTSFGYNALVFDPCSLAFMRSFGYPVCMDITHAVQQPGGAGAVSGGRREMVPTIARAATAVGVDALFIETHPDPERALSDSATMIPLDELEGLLRLVRDLDAVVRRGPSETGGSAREMAN